MDHTWKLLLGFFGFQILNLCSCFPTPFHRDVMESEVPGALLGVALLLVSVVCLVACVCCRENQRKGFKEFRDSTHSIHQAGLSFTNPALTAGSELAIFPPPGVTSLPSVTFEPLPSPSALSPVTVHLAKKPSTYRSLTADSLSDTDWFGEDKLDFPRQQLQYLRECGQGWFGQVVEGEARGLSDTRYKVMVRILREDATPAEQKFFLNEAKPYRDLDHINVLKMLGRCLETNPYLILLEHCSAGDLKSFLCGNLTSSGVLVEQGVCLRIMCQVAAGLQHMINHGFVHTDLAARNCLVTSDLTVKVGDYGTSIEIYKNEYYVAGDVAVPVRWCAPETLLCTPTTIETKQVTAESNVWSLGVVLWEICQFGQMPYSEFTDDQVIVRVLGSEGLRLPIPTLHALHSNALYRLMCLCWQPPSYRASLDHVMSMLNHLHSSHSEEDFQRRWDTLRPNTITPEINLETMAARSDFDSGVDLEIKSTDRDILDLVKKSSSEINLSSSASPQLSVASSSGGEFFSQTNLSVVKKDKSPSLTNLRGSIEDISKPLENKKQNVPVDKEDFESWLKGVDTTNEEDVKFVKKISEAIKDLDDALALEKTSSSSDDSSRQESPLKDSNTQDENPVLDFRLGPLNEVRKQINLEPLTLQEDSLVRRDSSGSDTDETWRKRIERGEFSEKVKEKSKSVTDLMVLTHIESEGSESDSLPSLTRQYSIEMTKRKLSGPKMSTIGFSSEGNIRGAVLGEEFQDSLKQLQAVWKMKDMESRENSLQFIRNEADTSQTLDQLDFLCIEASEKYSKLDQTITKSSHIRDNMSVQVPSSSPVFEMKLEKDSVQKSVPNLNDSEFPKNLERSEENSKNNPLETQEPLQQLKISPELSEVSESSQTTESSSEISTPTQYEVQVFLNKEREHNTLPEENNQEGTKSGPNNYTQPTQSFDPLNNNCIEKECLSSCKTVLECAAENESENKIVPMPDITYGFSIAVDNVKPNCDIKLTPDFSNECMSEKLFLGESDKCSIDNFSIKTQDNLESNDLVRSQCLLSNSATTDEFNDPSVNLVVKSGETCSSINNLKQPFNDICTEKMGMLHSSDEKQPDIFVPEIVVTEASILNVESDSESETPMPPITRNKRSFRIVLSSSDDETEGEDDLLENISVTNCERFINDEIVTSTPFNKVKASLSADETYSEVDPTFPESITSESFIVPLQQKVDEAPTNLESSVIFGSCEDYTLEYFKGLKTTLGKQTSDESNDEFSKSEGEEEERKHVLSRNWNNYHTHSVEQEEYNKTPLCSDLKFERNDNNLELNEKDGEEKVVNNLNSFSDGHPLKPKIKLSEHFNEDIRKDIIICDRINMFDNLSEKQNLDDHDQQMHEVKIRLEDVAKLSESFCLRSQNISTDDEENGKLLTPDDERSSDSGFRDKGSLSESVEDACDEKYNLEDIEAELDEQYNKQVEPKSFDESQDNWEEKKDLFSEQKESEHLRVRREDTFIVSSDSEPVDVKDLSNSTTSTIKPSECSHESSSTLKASDSSCENSLFHDDEQERFNKLDSSLNSDIDLYFETNTKEKTGWYLHPPPGSSTVNLQPVTSGWLPAAPEESRDSSYVSFDIDEEFVTAIRNELREKLPCAQNPEQTDNEDDLSPEEERTDLIIQYNTFPVPLSPILEERESVSSNQSSLLLDENGKSFDESSGRSSPMLYLEARKESNVFSRFEEDICNAMDNCNSESTESDNVLVTVEDLENSKAGKAEKVVEHKKDEMDDLLIVDTETNKVTLFESPRPKSQLAFVKQAIEPCDDNVSVNSETYSLYHSVSDNVLSVDRNNLTFTPDSVSPLSTGSSRTGVAVSFSSSETEDNISGFYLSPSSVRSEMFDNGPPSLPFDLGLIQDLVEEIKPNNEAEEIVQELVEAGVIKEEDLNGDSKTVVNVTNCGLINSKETPEDSTDDIGSETSSEQPENSETPITSTESKSETDSLSDSNKLLSIMKGSFNLNSLQLCNLPKNNSCDRIDDILKAGVNKIKVLDENQIDSKVSDSQEWLKSILLSSSHSSECGDEVKNEGVLVCVNNDAWPSSEELIAQPIPKVKCESQVTVTTPESPNMDLLEVAAKFYDVNSTLAISTPNNVSFDESKDNSQLSSFTSTPTLETAKCISGTFKSVEKAGSGDTLGSEKKLVKIVTSIPPLSSLASDIVLRLPPNEPKEDFSDESILDEERVKRLQGMTLALEPSMISKAPMPSPEDADKGTWRPTMGQLMELTNQPDQDDMMTTSFIDADNNDYTPDWESDTSDDSEEHSSSSGEFIWREGEREEAVHVVIACDDEPQEGVSEMSMARISEEEEEEEEDDGEDNSSCGSATEFIPSIWDSNATPTKSALRSTEKPKSKNKRNVIFKRQKYHCVYEYPREPSDSEDDEPSILQRRTWQTPTSFDYSTYADWEYGDGEVEEAAESDSDDAGPRNLPDSEYDFYRLSNLDFETMTQMNLDEGEFFISSSARPFQMGDSSQFFPGNISDEDFLVEFQPSASDIDRPQLDETVNGNLREPGKPEETKVEKEKQKPNDLFIVAEPLNESSSSAEVSPTLGELRHTRQKLKLDLGRGAVRGEASLLDSGGEDSGVESTATGSSDRLDQVQASEA